MARPPAATRIPGQCHLQPAIDRRRAGASRHRVHRAPWRLHRQRTRHDPGSGRNDSGSRRSAGPRPRHDWRQHGAHRARIKIPSTTRVPGFPCAWKTNDNWDTLLQYNQQHFQADGYFYEYPVGPNPEYRQLGDYQIQAFAPAYSKDQYWSRRGPMNARFPGLFGSFGDLQAVYTGSYMNRSIDGQQDYSNYRRPVTVRTTPAAGKGAGYFYFRSAKPTSCYSPSGNWRDIVDEHPPEPRAAVQHHADRPPARPRRRVLREDFVIKDNMNFNYMQHTAVQSGRTWPSRRRVVRIAWRRLDPSPGFYALASGRTHGTNTAFGEDVRRGYKQTAFFASVDFDIIPQGADDHRRCASLQVRRVRAGLGVLQRDLDLLNVPNGTCTGTCGFGINLNKSESGWKTARQPHLAHHARTCSTYFTLLGRVPPGWLQPHQDQLLDGTVVAQGAWPPTPRRQRPQFLQARGLRVGRPDQQRDRLQERVAGAPLQVNLSAYQMDWKNVQMLAVRPGAPRQHDLRRQWSDVPRQGHRAAGDRAAGRWASRSQGSSVLELLRTDQRPLPGEQRGTASKGNPTPVGQCITQINGAPYTNPFGVLGTAPRVLAASAIQLPGTLRVEHGRRLQAFASPPA